MSRQADLNPPLGKPGGPCHVIRRIRDEIEDQRLEDNLVALVERNKDLSNPDAAQVYDLEAEPGVGIFRQLVITPHAQYRMDLRGIGVDQVRQALANFLKQLNDWKSQKAYEYREHADALSYGEPINWPDRKTGLTVVFRGDGGSQVRLITTYPTGKPDPKYRPGQCVVAYRTPDLSGYQTFVKNPLPGLDPSERAADAEKEQVLPSPPWGRSKPQGKPQYNTPPGSADALDGKPLSTDRVRTIGVPGEHSPHPDLPATNTIVRRPGLTAAVKGPPYPGADRQREQGGKAKRYHEKYYQQNSNDINRKVEKWQRQHKTNPAFQRDKKLRQEHPERFERKPGGVRDPADRAREWRENQKAASRVAARWADLLYDRRPPEMDPEQVLNRADRDYHDHHHAPAHGFDGGSVFDNPGSAKVIPEGHGFQNKEDRYLKEAARISEILDKTSRKVHDSAKKVSIKLRRVDAQNMMWSFDVPGSQGTYKVRVKALSVKGSSALDKVDVRVSCSCPFWQWQGPEHWAQRNGYLYGKPVGTATRPDEKDPDGRHWACKHVIAVLRKVQTFVTPGKPKGRLASLQYLANSLTSGGRVVPDYEAAVRVAARYLEGRRF